MSIKQSKRRKQFSPEERAEYKQQKREESRRMLEDATRALLTSDGWKRWCETRAKFHRYSFGNTMLIAMQCPDATAVAGFKRWQEMGRQVRKGEHGIHIVAPCSVKERDDETGEETRRTFFKGTSVFDIAQTDGDPLPEPPREPITGDSHAAFIPKLVAFSESIGFPVVFEELGDRGGYCMRSESEQRIGVRSDLPPNAQVRVLVHEIAHAHGVGRKEYGRERAEVIVESAAFIVCQSIGLDTSGESVPYVAGWGEEDQVAAIRQFAELVHDLAAKIEAALD